MIKDIAKILLREAVMRIASKAPILRAPAAAIVNKEDLAPYRGTSIGFGCELRMPIGKEAESPSV